MTKTNRTRILILAASTIIYLDLMLISFNLALATTNTTAAQTATDSQIKPGIVMVITFPNGTTKVLQTNSTNIQAINGGYVILDSSVTANGPLPVQVIDEKVVNKFITDIDTRIIFKEIEKDSREISSKGCEEGWGYYVDDPTPICEPFDAIGKGPPKDMAFCAALGCPYNPPNPHGLPVAPPEPEPPITDCPPGFYCIDDPVVPEDPPESPTVPKKDVTCAAVGCPEPDPVEPEPEPAPEPEEPEQGNNEEEESSDGSEENTEE